MAKAVGLAMLKRMMEKFRKTGPRDLPYVPTPLRTYVTLPSPCSDNINSNVTAAFLHRYKADVAAWSHPVALPTKQPTTPG